MMILQGGNRGLLFNNVFAFVTEGACTKTQKKYPGSFPDKNNNKIYANTRGCRKESK
jgi:hypothetical protein